MADSKGIDTEVLHTPAAAEVAEAERRARIAHMVDDEAQELAKADMAATIVVKEVSLVSQRWPGSVCDLCVNV